MHISTRIYGQVCNSSSLHQWATYRMGAGKDSSQVPFDFESETLQNIMYDRPLTISKQASWTENNSERSADARIANSKPTCLAAS